MIVEITGPNGCGKSETVRMLKSMLEKSNISTLVIGENENRNQFSIPTYVTNVNLHSLRTDVFLFIRAFYVLIKNPRFTYLIIRSAFTLSGGNKVRISVLRSIWRKVGIYSYVRSIEPTPSVILIDEGIIHSAHNVLVDSINSVNDKNVKKFINLTPVYDLTVILTAPINVLTKRLNKRGDLSPRIKDKDSLESFTMHAALMFDMLSKQMKSRNKTLVCNTQKKSSREIANYIMKKIKDFK